MAETFELGPASFIDADAIGQPGQRRFRMRLMNDDAQSAVVWLEKEQLAALGDALETVLREEGYEYERPPLDEMGMEPVFPLNPTVELQAAQLSMGVARVTQQIVIIAGDGDDEGVSITAEISYQRGFELRQEIAEVVAAGRPPCPLCGAPMDPSGHICPRSNGHHPQ